MNKLLSVFVLLIMSMMALSAKTYKVEDIPNVHKENRNRYVSNPDGVLSDATVAELDALLSDLWQKTTAEVVLVAVDRVEGSDIDDFATNLFTHWGIGKSDNDNGLLILIAKDDRKAAIRTGYGMEGVVPDVIAGRIIRNVMAPHFRNNDYDAGSVAAMNEIARLVTATGATDELRSQYENDMIADDLSLADVFKMWMMFGGLVAVAVALWVGLTVWRTRNLDRFERYNALNGIKIGVFMLTFIGLGVPIVVALYMFWKMRRLRIKRRVCPNCHNRMRRLDEHSDNAYLTAAQDAEERINSIDYDVWLCDNCGETDILPYVNKSVNYTRCPRCGARACGLQSDRVIYQATATREGRGVREYVCRSCGNRNQVPYELPKIIVPPVIIGGGGGRGFGGGSGFSGGSFGGGFTGGGGASGGW